MRSVKNTLAFISAAALLAVSFASCGSSEESSSESSAKESSAAVTEKADDESESAASGDQKTVKIGIGKAVLPFSGLNDDEKLEGYDYDILKEIEPLLEDKYKFEYYPDEFANILIGLDTNLYDIAVHHYGWTAERSEKYLYAENATMYFGNFVVGYSEDIDPLTDDPTSLSGLTIATSKGSMAETLLTNYNDKNPGYEVNLEYIEDTEVLVSGIKSGLYDGYCCSAYDLNTLNNKYDDLLIQSEFSLTASDYNCGTYFIYSIGDDELKNDIDEALTQLKEDGKLLELSEKWLGGDFTENPNA